MSELRQDRTSGLWVIVAPERGLRPRQGAEKDTAPRRDAARCPFCPGHESELPGIIAEFPAPSASGWQVRVVPNKYPALQAHPPPPASVEGAVRPGYGFHEVIIESPRHDVGLADLAADAMRVVAAAYRDRMHTLLGRPDIESVVLFRNRGARAGASLAHPHAQVIALGLEPQRMAAISAWGGAYHAREGRCATCDELTLQLRQRERIVEENARFISLVPFAAEHPCELWLLPRSHQASFADLGADALDDFAALLRSSLRRIRLALDDPPYNFVVETAPRRELNAPHLHWRLRIVPGIAVWGGFELGSGLAINPSSPEEDARLLRAQTVGA